MLPESKKILLCADDYGMNSAISLAILELVHLERLSAVSCMVNFPEIYGLAQQLLALQKPLQIGLHLNFTEGNSLTRPGTTCDNFINILVKSHLRRFSIQELKQEMHLQIDRFIDAFGFSPDFIDGHQHVHQFPQLRQALLEIYTERLPNAWIRCTYPYLSAAKFRLKSQILALTGGRALKRQLDQRAIPHNAFFSGVYNLSRETCYARLFRAWLAVSRDNTLIMCHPGHKGFRDKDPIAESRVVEFAYLSSQQFLDDCEQYGIIYKPTISMLQR